MQQDLREAGRSETDIAGGAGRFPSPTVRFPAPADRWLALTAVALLLIVILASSRANIVADSVDYYAILQRLTSPADKPIVRNLHFVEQRSPGYPIVALLPYALLSIGVAPFVSTERVADVPPSGAPGAPPPPAQGGVRLAPPRPKGEMGSEFALIPPRPLLLRDLAFKDFYVPGEGSWFRWKQALALALTSYLFLFGGMLASARALKLTHPELPLYFLVPAGAFASPIFLHNIVATPLYATMAAYGASSLFVLFFIRGYGNRTTRDLLAAGFFLGLLVLTRLEVSVFAVTLGALLLTRRDWRVVAGVFGGALPAPVAWLAYNLSQFGIPFHLGILRGDINHIALNLGFVFENLAHPSSGVLFWSPLVALGLAGLVASRSTGLRLLGFSSLALLALYLVRVPIMYEHLGGGVIDIGGIPVTAPSTPAAMREMVRSDINRYVTVMIPAAVLGFRDGIAALQRRLTSHRGSETANA